MNTWQKRIQTSIIIFLMLLIGYIVITQAPSYRHKSVMEKLEERKAYNELIKDMEFDLMVEESLHSLEELRIEVENY